eukprot:s165_g18.t1
MRETRQTPSSRSLAGHLIRQEAHQCLYRCRNMASHLQDDKEALQSPQLSSSCLTNVRACLSYGISLAWKGPQFWRAQSRQRSPQAKRL